MRFRGRRVLAIILMALAPAGLAAHDTWLLASRNHVKPGERVRLRLATSEEFPTSETAAAAGRVEQLTIESEQERRDIRGYQAMGKFLVADVLAPGHGDAVILLTLKPLAFELESEIFNKYLADEGLTEVIAAREKQGKAKAAGRERYRKIAKTMLCGEGETGEIYKKPQGAWLEIIPEVNPCRVLAGDKLTLQVLFQGKPLGGAHVGAGYPGVKGHGYPIWVKTDEEGRVTIAVERTGLWFVRVLHMVAADGKEADWDSAFSTLTFSVVRGRERVRPEPRGEN